MIECFKKLGERVIASPKGRRSDVSCPDPNLSGINGPTEDTFGEFLAALEAGPGSYWFNKFGLKQISLIRGKLIEGGEVQIGAEIIDGIIDGVHYGLMSRFVNGDPRLSFYVDANEAPSNVRSLVMKLCGVSSLPAGTSMITMKTRECLVISLESLVFVSFLPVIGYVVINSQNGWHNISLAGPEPAVKAALSAPQNNVFSMYQDHQLLVDGLIKPLIRPEG